jgi:hypothetical protein
MARLPPTTTNCVRTAGDAHESATAEFEEASSQLEELGYSHEISADGVHVPREPVVCRGRAWCMMYDPSGVHLSQTRRQRRQNAPPRVFF